MANLAPRCEAEQVFEVRRHAAHGQRGQRQPESPERQHCNWMGAREGHRADSKSEGNGPVETTQSGDRLTLPYRSSAGGLPRALRMWAATWRASSTEPAFMKWTFRSI